MNAGRINMRWMMLMLVATVVLGAAGCRPDTEDRELQFMPDMYRNPAVKPQEEYPFFRTGLGSLVPPEGTIPQNYTPYPFDITEGPKAGEELANPLPMTEEVLAVGQKYYNIHCITCHGATGAGDGLSTIVNRENGMPVPPELYTDKINDWKDGQIYHTITLGQGQMPGYAPRIDPSHRWAIVHYVRALYSAANPEEGDLEAVEKLGWEAKAMDSPLIEDATPEDMRQKRSIFRLVPDEEM